MIGACLATCLSSPCAISPIIDGLGPVEIGNLPIPARFAGIAAARYELQRSVSHFYAAAEARLLPRIDEKR